MSDPSLPPVDMALLPVQLPLAPASPAEARARFFNSGNAFNQKLAAVPPRDFADVAAQALACGHSAWFDCDQSQALGCGFAATTPLMLARYASVAAGGELPLQAQATGLLAYVIRGQARCVLAAAAGGQALPLAAGDVLLLPGGLAHRLQGGPEGALLWVVDNQPQLALDGSQPVLPPHAAVEPVHYPAAEIERQLAVVLAAGSNEQTSGRALIFSSERLQASRNLMPSLTLSLNTLGPGEHQPPHRHNSAAITLVLQGERCHSLMDGEPCAWTPWTTLVTPPGMPHSHHNQGQAGARFLIVQDGGLHYHARTMGFEFLPAAPGVPEAPPGGTAGEPGPALAEASRPLTHPAPPTGAPARASGWRRAWQSSWLSLGSVGALLLLWLLGAWLLPVSVLPGPVLVVKAAWAMTAEPQLWADIQVTLGRIGLAFALGMALSLALGFAMALSRRAGEFFRVWIVCGITVPAIVTILTLYMAVGMNERAAVLGAALTVVPFLTINVREGVKAMDTRLLHMGQVFRASRWQLLRGIMLPQVAPMLLASARFGLGLVWKMVLFVELLGRSDGVGYRIEHYFQLFDMTSVLAYALCFLVVMLFIEVAVFGVIERRAFRWRRA